VESQVRVPKRLVEAQKAKSAAIEKQEKEKKMEKSQGTCTVKQGVRIALITPTYLRTLLKNGKVAGKKLDNNEWDIEVASLREYAREAQTRLDKRQASLRDGTYGQNVRPTVATAQRMRKFVKEDTILAEAEKEVFLAAIDRYEAQKDAEYAKREAKAEK